MTLMKISRRHFFTKSVAVSSSAALAFQFEEKVLKLRFGLDNGRTHTLEEIGREFNVSRERIRQIEAKALCKMRDPSRSKYLRDFLE